MKRTLLKTTMALALVAGGTITASAASTIETFNGYFADMNWGSPTNPTIGTTTAIIWQINRGPSTPDNVFPQISGSVSVDTDGSGKIIGSGFVFVQYDFSSNNPPVSAFLVDVSGKVSQSGSSATKVTMTLKGDGATAQDSTGTNVTSASINVKFDGSPATNPDTNTATTIPQIIAGTLNGSIKGKTPVDDKTTKISNRAADLGAIGASRDFLRLTGQVIANNKNLQFFGSANGGDVSGKGTVKNGATYKFSPKGLGRAKGASLNVDGNLTTSTTNIVIIGTNAPVEVIIKTPGTANVKGKAVGQSVSGAAQSIEVEPGFGF